MHLPLDSSPRRRLFTGAGSLLVVAFALPTPGGEVLELLEPPGLDFVHTNGRAGGYHLAEITCGGVALFDYDGDGDLDVYLTQGRPLGESPTAIVDGTAAVDGDRLYRNELDAGGGGPLALRFRDVTGMSGLTATGYGCGVAAGDADNDGRIDLYVANLGANELWRNRGDGSFIEAAAEVGVAEPRWSASAAFLDYDGDGWLDLYVANYVDFDVAAGKVCRGVSGVRDYCHPDAYPGVPDRLFRNRGDGRFEDVTATAGIDRVASKSLGVVSSDFDGDGRLDVYVANDSLPNQLWLQTEPGRFVDGALYAGCAVNGKGRPEASMGVVAEDFDGDGDVDLFMTHLVRESNTLYVNDGHGLFEDKTGASGLGGPSWPSTSWGISAADFDGDGHLDLLIANGAVRAIEELTRIGDPFPFHQPNQLFRGLGGGRFEEVPAAGPSAVSRGVASGDLDNDGDVDAVVVNIEGPAWVLRNRVGQDRRWLGLRLVGRGGRDMLGARAAVTAPARPPLWRRARTDGSFASANDPRLTVGIGAAAGAVGLRLWWPDGRREILSRAVVGRYMTRVERDRR